MSLFPGHLLYPSAYQVHLEHTPVVVQHRLRSGVLHSQLQRSTSPYLAFGQLEGHRMLLYPDRMPTSGVLHSLLLRSTSPYLALGPLEGHCMSLYPDRMPKSGGLQNRLLQSTSPYLAQKVRHR